MKSAVLVVALLIISIIASAYVWYFIGMTVSLAAGAILGVASAHIAQIFAWIGVVFIVIFFGSEFLKSTREDEAVNDGISEEEFAKLFEDIEKE